MKTAPALPHRAETLGSTRGSSGRYSGEEAVHDDQRENAQIAALDADGATTEITPFSVRELCDGTVAPIEQHLSVGGWANVNANICAVRVFDTARTPRSAAAFPIGCDAMRFDSLGSRIALTFAPVIGDDRRRVARHAERGHNFDVITARAQAYALWVSAQTSPHLFVEVSPRATPS